MKINLEKVSLEVTESNFVITVKKDVKIPTTAYKYYYLNSNSINSLSDKTIHFGHSNKMNDLMDGNFLLWDFEEFLLDYLAERKIPLNYKELYREFLLNKLSTEFLKHIGYFCLCEDFKNDLLWAHYTNERGFCIEYDLQKLFNNFKEKQTYFLPINYCDLQQINFKKYSKKTVYNNQVNVNSNIPLFYCLVNKEKFWNYEKEWRLIIRDENFSEISNPLEYISDLKKNMEPDALQTRNIRIDDSCIKKIILSTYFFDNNRFDECLNKQDVIILRFTKNTALKELKKFIKILIRSYSDQIYQVDKYLYEGKIMRDIKYKITFLKIDEDYLEYTRTLC